MEDKKLNNEEIENEALEENKVIEAIDKLDNEENNKEESKGVNFFKKFLVGIIDQIISIAISLVLLIVFDLVLKLFGFYVAEREPMFLVMYIIVNIFYAPICTSIKLKETIGKKIILK